MASSSSLESNFQSGSRLKERNYLGLSDSSSVDSSAVSSLSEDKDNNLNLKATELRLGLPGSQSPHRDPEISLLCSEKLDEKPLFPLLPTKDGICSSSQKTIASGYKRGFSYTVEGSSEKGHMLSEGNWVFNGTGPTAEPPKPSMQEKSTVIPSMNGMQSVTQPIVIKEVASKVSHGQPLAINLANHNKINGSNDISAAPAAKAQVVGWPPIRSFRKNTLAMSSKSGDEVDGKPGPAALFVKVSMDGAPYLRKVDLRSHCSYQELSMALEKMFSCFIIGQCGSHGALGRTMNEGKLRDLSHGSDYLLTYEDKDGDWMLVGDVPWEMFICSCKRLKIMQGSDAIGLAPRAMEKSVNKN